jgi:mRNA (guanine-N7-)-methyltransferase
MGRRVITPQQRPLMEAHQLKCINNFVKACVLDVTVRAHPSAVLDVADIACGRGQDVTKWMHAAKAAGKRFGVFYGMDIAETGVASVVDTFIAPMADRTVFVVGDMSVEFKGVPDGTMDVVSCQLALHYLCDDATHLDGFMRECARVLRPDGFMLLSFADGRSVVRRCRDAWVRETPSIHCRQKYYDIAISTEHLRRNVPSPYGARYVFSLADSIDALPECLCHEGEVHKVASRHGFLTGTSMYFDEALTAFRKQAYLQTIAAKMKCVGIDDADALDAANLYRFMVFSKSDAMQRAWITALNHGPSTHRYHHHARPATHHLSSPTV